MPPLLSFVIALSAGFAVLAGSTPAGTTGDLTGHRHAGMSGASAVIFLDAHRVVVASDEDNRLRVYDPTASQPAVTAWDASP